jgi:OPA family glycerol-3-phosphate transporter-like MFS transporter
MNTSDLPVHSPEFRKQRVINWMSLGVLYAFFYMTRYNYTAVAPALADLLGWKNTELGVFETIMPLIWTFRCVEWPFR